MTSRIDEMCPPDVGDSKIRLTLDNQAGDILAHVPFEINVDYTAAEPVGISLPLELIVQGPVAGQFSRRVFTHAKPNSIVATAKSGGKHLVLLRELYHNRWQGKLFLDVQGEDVLALEDR